LFNGWLNLAENPLVDGSPTSYASVPTSPAFVATQLPVWE